MWKDLLKSGPGTQWTAFLTTSSKLAESNAFSVHLGLLHVSCFSALKKSEVCTTPRDGSEEGGWNKRVSPRPADTAFVRRISKKCCDWIGSRLLLGVTKLCINMQCGRKFSRTFPLSCTLGPGRVSLSGFHLLYGV